MPGSFVSVGSSVGSTIEVSEIESLADGTIVIGDGSGAPTTLAAFSSATGTLKVANGGSGAATLTGILKGNGTSAFTAATAGTDYVAPAVATVGALLFVDNAHDIGASGATRPRSIYPALGVRVVEGAFGDATKTFGPVGTPSAGFWFTGSAIYYAIGATGANQIWGISSSQVLHRS